MNDPFRVLGLGRDASAVEVRSARRDLAKQHHPDVGGDAELMRSINTAAGAALDLIAERLSLLTVSTRRPDQAPEQQGETGEGPGSEPFGATRDIPSFTVEALPVETFEALLVVTGWIGKVLDDDPPYRLDTHLYEPRECWCRLELVPDAGASTVSITVAAYAEQPPPSIESVRDTWVEQLNRYDWD
jgi:curved DNA-binding protein CbpA